ncbi:MAG: Rib/alpha-like domain-containing protein [bacterium]|nr:Rib/alpha-like domain-containing protein [bacterium]
MEKNIRIKNKTNFKKLLFFSFSLFLLFIAGIYNKMLIEKEELNSKILNQELNDSKNYTYMAQASSRIIYVTEGNENSIAGDGSTQNPYQSLSYAISQANHGDTIKIMTGIVYRQQVANETFKINKSITIDGQGNYLNFRGSNLEILANVKLVNMNLIMIPDGVQQSKIYVSGNQITFDNVSTLISRAQYDQRPMIIGGSKDYGPMGSHTVINIFNGSSETRFKEIIVGKENSDISTPATININSAFSKVDNGIVLGGSGYYQVTGKVKVISNSRNINNIYGSNSTDNEVTIRSATIYNLNLTGIKKVILSDRAHLSLKKFYGLNGDIEVKSGTQLWISTPGEAQVDNILGTGEVVISAGSSLNVRQNIVDATNIKIRGFDSELQQNLNKVFLTVGGSINSGATVSLYSSNDYYKMKKDGNKYKLVENTEFDKNNIKKIEVLQKPTKLSYLEGEKIDLSGINLKLTDSNNTEESIGVNQLSEYNITYLPTSTLKTTNKEIILKVNNIKTSIAITVSKKSTPTKTQAQTYEPTATNKTITKGDSIKAEDIIKNKSSLPKNTTYKFKNSLDTSKVGKQEIEIIVTYPDTSKDTVSFTLTVKTKTSDKSTQATESKESSSNEKKESSSNDKKESSSNKKNNNDEENKLDLISDSDQDNTINQEDINNNSNEIDDFETDLNNNSNEKEVTTTNDKKGSNSSSIIGSIIGITVIGVSIPTILKVKKLKN